jgi:uncharacterized protein with von Willebrand factor type A (vWA) domain
MESENLYHESNRKYPEMIRTYLLEYKEDVKLDQVNLTEKSMQNPAIKARWVARMVEIERERNDLEKLLKKSMKAVCKQEKDKSAIQLSQAALEKLAKESEFIQKIQERIDLVEEVKKCLEMIVKTVQYFGTDISTALECVKLETT